MKASKCHQKIDDKQLVETQDWLLERRWKWWCQNVKKKENWSSKRYEIIKLSFGDATLVIEILFIAAAHTDLLMALLEFLMMHK